MSFYSSRHVSNLEVSVQRHICSEIQASVRKLQVFACFSVWFGCWTGLRSWVAGCFGLGQQLGAKKGSVSTDCAPGWMKYHDDHDHGHDYHEE
jgi:hypothetical protein